MAILLLISCAPNTPPSTSSSTALHIPFHLERDKIILPVTIGDSRGLKVILDTGMSFEGILLYSTEGIALKNGIEVLVPGTR
ncbi:hypothetical protein AMJ87_09580 [candidate division WOR_3 bacterium SM23_60]|uniref:Uncharacterized protein n=1 Tax=candidate division WOR_3 bacterium SM23_60 TaxID=1703780 RepID=A0A0S8GB82_UNCW3|nr:MAG: hypothetical protein AMJ87_09580 [candidate division WOR_3 bacterium SM23_60]